MSDALRLATFAIWLLGAFVASWGASLALRALASRIEIVALRLQMRRARSPAGAGSARPALALPKALSGLILGPVLLAGGIWLILAGTNIHRWAISGRLRDLFIASPWSFVAAALCVLAATCAWVGWRYDPARARRRCPACWYDFRGLPLGLCPECGRPVLFEPELLRTRRSRALIAIAPIALVGAMLAAKAPQIASSGWRAAIPTTVLIAGFDLLPDTLLDDPKAMRASNDGPLLARAMSDQLWDWQADWLQEKARRAFASAKSVEEIQHALRFANDRAFLTQEPFDADSFRAVVLTALRTGSSLHRLLAISIIGQFQPVFGDIDQTLIESLAPVIADPTDSIACGAAFFISRNPRVIAGLRKPLLAAAVNQSRSRPYRLHMLATLQGLSEPNSEVAELIDQLGRQFTRRDLIAVRGLVDSVIPNSTLIAGHIAAAPADVREFAALIFERFAANRLTESELASAFPAGLPAPFVCDLSIFLGRRLAPPDDASIAPIAALFIPHLDPTGPRGYTASLCAVNALALLGPRARSALEPLRLLVDNPAADTQLRQAAASAFDTINQPRPK